MLIAVSIRDSTMMEATGRGDAKPTGFEKRDQLHFPDCRSESVSGLQTVTVYVAVGRDDE